MSGCASWSPPGDAKSPLQTPRTSPEAVKLDFRFVTIPWDENPTALAEWPGVDEQSLTADLRRELLANGIRCGIVGPQLPSWLEVASSRPPQSVEETISDSNPDNFMHRMQTLNCRPGKTTRIVVSGQPQREMPILMCEDGVIRGESFRNSQGIMELKVVPHGDRRVQVELMPQIEFGEPKQEWIGDGGLFLLDTSRERRRFEQLTVKVTLAIGETLVIGCSEDPCGLGGQFFSDTNRSGTRRRLLLLRLNETELDDLFVPEEPRAAVVPQE